MNSVTQNLNGVNTNLFFILGAADPEMNLIEEILKGNGVPFVYATLAGERVSPASAYKADAVEIPQGLTPVWVECRPLGGAEGIVVDHHNPGDPGFSCDPKEFLKGSSIGQILLALYVPEGHTGHLSTQWGASLLVYDNSTDECVRQIPIPREVVLAAASDHCPGHAYKGKCPGVDPQELMEFRAARRAAFLNKDIKEVLEGIEKGMEEMEALPIVEIKGGVMLHRLYDAVGREITDLPEASLRLGKAVQYSLAQRDGRVKIGVLNGSPRLLKAWMEQMSKPDSGLVDIYGAPERGYAGGYKA